MTKQLKKGIKIEKEEHSDTFKWLKEYVEKHKKFPSEEEYAKRIALDHLKEFKDYYTHLAKMEKELKEKLKKVKAKKEINNIIDELRLVKMQIELLGILTQRYNKNTKRKEWALVSRSNPKKILKWFGVKKPSKERVMKEERRVQYFKHH